MNLCVQSAYQLAHSEIALHGVTPVRLSFGVSWDPQATLESDNLPPVSDSFGQISSLFQIQHGFSKFATRIE